MKRILALLAIGLALSLALPAASTMAHGAMFTFKQIDGPNIIMVTHNVHDAQTGIPIQYNLRMYDMTGQPVHFTTVQTEFKIGSKSMGTHISNRTDNADAVLTHTYTKAGEYTFLVRFMDGDKKVAASEFPIIVAKGQDDGIMKTIFSGPSVIGFFVGLAVAGLVLDRQKLGKHLTFLKRKK